MRFASFFLSKVGLCFLLSSGLLLTRLASLSGSDVRAIVSAACQRTEGGMVADPRFSTVDDLVSLDPELYHGLMILKNYTGNVETELSLNFTVTDEGELACSSSLLLRHSANLTLHRNRFWRLSHHRPHTRRLRNRSDQREPDPVHIPHVALVRLPPSSYSYPGHVWLILSPPLPS